MNKELLLFLQRIGVNTEQEFESPDQAQQALLKAVMPTFQSSEFGESLVEKGRNERQGLLMKKIKAGASKLGVESDDIETIFNEVESKIKEQSTKAKEKNKEEEGLQDKYRQLELSYQKLEQEKAALTDSFEQEKAAIQQNSEKYVKDYIGFMEMPLTEAGRANAQDYFEMINKRLGSAYDVHQEGYLLKKGTEEPVYKEGSTEKITKSHFIEQQLEGFGIKKETDIQGSGDPDQGGSAPSEPQGYFAG